MKDQNEIMLFGIDGANPLGFLTALGTTITAMDFCPKITISWRIEHGAWRPVICGFDGGRLLFIERLHDALTSSSLEPFKIEKRLPFHAQRFAKALQKIRNDTTMEDRRTADLLSAYGSEVCLDKENFQDTMFRMVRSGDSAGQGFPFYVASIRNATGANELHNTLFEIWNYQDDAYSLRWDPVEDQRYALRWDDPAKKKDKHALRTMLGANALAVEALRLFPAVPITGKTITSGFSRNDKKQVLFTWPIWNSHISMDIVRSLVVMPDLHVEHPPRKKLASRGIVEIYRSIRIAANQYYRNFTISVPA